MEEIQAQRYHADGRPKGRPVKIKVKPNGSIVESRAAKRHLQEAPLDWIIRPAADPQNSWLFDVATGKMVRQKDTLDDAGDFDYGEGVGYERVNTSLLPITDTDDIHAHGNYLTVTSITPLSDTPSIGDLGSISSFAGKMRRLLRNTTAPIRFQISAKVLYEKENMEAGDGGEPALEEVGPHWETGRSFIVKKAGSVAKQLREATDDLRNDIDKKKLKGSGLIVKKIEKVTLQSVKYDSLNEISGYVPTPAWLSDKKACLNLNNSGSNRDNQCARGCKPETCQHCFEHAVICSLAKIPVEINGKRTHRNRLSTYSKFYTKAKPRVPQDLDVSMLKFPVPCCGCMCEDCENCNMLMKFERANNLALNIIRVDDTAPFADVLPELSKFHEAYRSTNRTAPVDRFVWLLILENQNNFHYISVSNISALLHTQAMPHAKHSAVYCPFCWKAFAPNDKKKSKTIKSAEQKLLEHLEKKECQNVDGKCCPTVMPEEGATLSFNRWTRKFPLPFFLVSDFESSLLKIQDGADAPKGAVQQHRINSYFIYVVCYYDDIDVSHLHRFKRIASDAEMDTIIRSFYDDLAQIQDGLKVLLNVCPKPELTDAAERLFKLQTKCHICERLLTECGPWDKEQPSRPVRDHCHLFPGDHPLHFRGAAHETCNIQLRTEVRERMTVPIFFHNLRGYDSHALIRESHLLQKEQEYARHSEELITKKMSSAEKQMKNSKKPPATPGKHELGDLCATAYTNIGPGRSLFQVGNPNIVAQNSERYVFFKIGAFQFNDSVSFMESKLSTLVENLAVSGVVKRQIFKHTFEYFKREYPTIDTKAFMLLIQKGIYPYSYVDSAFKFSEPSLPSIEHFRNDLAGEDCSAEDYEHAQKVWSAYNCKTFGDYHDIYLKLDVCLLADVMSNFRASLIKSHKLDPFHKYPTLPGYSWDCLLYHTQVKLDLISDEKMFEFIEDGIRGGVSFIGKKRATANNPYLEEYDETKERSYLSYVDANNLYGLAMSQPLPYRDLKWMTDEEIATFPRDAKGLRELHSGRDAMNHPNPYNPDDRQGWILKVRLRVPETEHDRMNSFPMAVDRMVIQSDMMSPYQQAYLKQFKIKLGKTPKLVPSLKHGQEYVVHSRNLQFYLEQGMELLEVISGITFVEKEWMRPYIDMNTSLRSQANNKFEKDLYKLMNNSVFGKTMENVRNRIEFRLQSTVKQMSNAGRNPLLKMPFIIYNENLTGATFHKKQVELNKPIYCGFGVLELSKLWMYKFHYEHILPTFGHENVDLCFTDTDSFCFHIKCDDFYQHMVEHSEEWYDTSDVDSEFKTIKGDVLHSNYNKKKLGMFKPETGSNSVKQFIGLRSKCYSLDVEWKGKPERKMAAKGVPKKSAERHLSHSAYEKCLMEWSPEGDSLVGDPTASVEYKKIGSRRHEVFTYDLQRRALCSFDDKTYMEGNDTESLRHGHYRTIRE